MSSSDHSRNKSQSRILSEQIMLIMHYRKYWLILWLGAKNASFMWIFVGRSPPFYHFNYHSMQEASISAFLFPSVKRKENLHLNKAVKPALCFYSKCCPKSSILYPLCKQPNIHIESRSCFITGLHNVRC